MDSISDIVPYLSNPLVLIGLVLLLVFSAFIAMIKAGLFHRLSSRVSDTVVHIFLAMCIASALLTISVGSFEYLKNDSLLFLRLKGASLLEYKEYLKVQQEKYLTEYHDSTKTDQERLLYKEKLNTIRIKLTNLQQFYDAEILHKNNSDVAKKAFLLVETIPQNAKVRILNILPPYQAGIALDPGEYHIEVTAEGYEANTRYHNVIAGNNFISVKLTKILSWKDVINIEFIENSWKRVTKSIDVYASDFISNRNDREEKNWACTNARNDALAHVKNLMLTYQSPLTYNNKAALDVVLGFFEKFSGSEKLETHLPKRDFEYSLNKGTCVCRKEECKHTFRVKYTFYKLRLNDNEFFRIRDIYCTESKLCLN